MNPINNSIVHLTMRFGDAALSIGTGFLYERQGKHYIVTAWHNVTGRNSESFELLNKNNAVPDNLLAYTAIVYPDIGPMKNSLVVPLDGAGKSLFFVHPNNFPRIDVVAIPINLDGDVEVEVRTIFRRIRQRFSNKLMLASNSVVTGEYCPVQKYLLKEDGGYVEAWFNYVDVTQELFIPGYPQNILGSNAQPVWKRATVASSVQSGWNGERKFLIDTASQSGMSGSPVFYYKKSGQLNVGGFTYLNNGPVAILAGVYVGRVGVTKRSDPQIGIVYHASVIDEIIDAGCFERSKAEIEINDRDLEDAIRKVFRTRSKRGLETIRNPAKQTHHRIGIEVMKLIMGRASRSRVLDNIMAIFESYEGPYEADKMMLDEFANHNDEENPS